MFVSHMKIIGKELNLRKFNFVFWVVSLFSWVTICLWWKYRGRGCPTKCYVLVNYWNIKWPQMLVLKKRTFNDWYHSILFWVVSLLSWVTICLWWKYKGRGCPTKCYVLVNYWNIKWTQMLVLKKTFNDWYHQNPQLFPVFGELFVTCLLQHINVSL